MTIFDVYAEQAVSMASRSLSRMENRRFIAVRTSDTFALSWSTAINDDGNDWTIVKDVQHSMKRKQMIWLRVAIIFTGLKCDEMRTELRNEKASSKWMSKWILKPRREREKVEEGEKVQMAIWFL